MKQMKHKGGFSIRLKAMRKPDRRPPGDSFCTKEAGSLPKKQLQLGLLSAMGNHVRLITQGLRAQLDGSY